VARLPRSLATLAAIRSRLEGVPQACIDAFKKPSKAPSAVGLFADCLFRDARLVLGSRPAGAAHEILHFL
jgi:hypothetical protein